MVSDFTVSDSDLTIWIWTPDDHFVILINYHYERSTNYHAIDADVVLKFNFSGSLKLAKDSLSPDVHDTFIGHCGWGVPCWYFRESVRSLDSVWFVFCSSWVDPNGWELVLWRIVADLAEIVGSKSPKFTSVAFAWVVQEHECVVLATSHSVDWHALQAWVLDLKRLNYAISIWVTKTELALVSISTSINFIVSRDKDRVSTSSLDIFDQLSTESLLWNHMWLKQVLKTVPIVCILWNTKGSVKSLTPSICLSIFT